MLGGPPPWPLSPDPRGVPCRFEEDSAAAMRQLQQQQGSTEAGLRAALAVAERAAQVRGGGG